MGAEGQGSRRDTADQADTVVAFDPADDSSAMSPDLLTAADDADLVAFVRSGSAEAFAELFRRHHDVARRVARRLSSREDADDIAAEAFERILDQLSRDKGPRDDFRSYLLASVRHEVFRRGRRNGREIPTEDDDDLDQISDAMDSNDVIEAQLVQAAFRRLPERWRRVLWLLDVEGYKPREVAEQLGLAPNGVSALAYRARKAMREAYLDQYASPVAVDATPCERARALFLGACQDMLRLSERHDLDLHLRGCVECRRDLGEVRALGIGPSSAGARAAAAGVAASTAHATQCRPLTHRGAGQTSPTDIAFVRTATIDHREAEPRGA